MVIRSHKKKKTDKSRRGIKRSSKKRRRTNKLFRKKLMKKNKLSRRKKKSKNRKIEIRRLQATNTGSGMRLLDLCTGK